MRAIRRRPTTAELSTRPRLPIFFFGTLMDPDVLSVVLARPLAPDEVEPATLRGFRRHAVVGAPYPVVRPDPLAHVPGVLFGPNSDDDRARIAHFEDEEYVASVVDVDVARRPRAAIVYREIEGVFDLAREAWSFDRFVREHKADYLAACRFWMSDFKRP